MSELCRATVLVITRKSALYGRIGFEFGLGSKRVLVEDTCRRPVKDGGLCWQHERREEAWRQDWDNSYRDHQAYMS